ncbi:MAG: leucine-rich repeat protein, partial [Candidatus Lokiarchaeia archaeon]|nr:leucine-rich repeat protein [Candidatus Lokiarchaeia archaeon]
MELHPDYIKENLDQIGKKEGLALLREWIDSSTDPKQRQNALLNYGLIDEGNNFRFFEHLYLSDEDIELRLIAGRILNEKYLHNKKLLPLMKYTLTRLDNVELQIFAIKTLNSIESLKARKMLIDYLRESIKKEFESKIKNFPKEIFNYNYNEAIPEIYLDICINLILYNFYTKKCGYHVSLKNGRISYLNCESSHITKINDINSLNLLKELEHLHLHRNNLMTLNGVQILKKLRTLDVSHNNLEKIEYLDGLQQLEELNLSNNRIRSIEGVNLLKNLEKLLLNQNSINRIENLDNLSYLKTLELTRNKIEEISNLDSLIELERLNLSFNRIEKIKGLQNLKNLMWLYLNSNKISKIEGLDLL